ncbi:hypothetical protein EC604_17300 [Paenibacillus amylolyticus]|jgi:hypothetical protein|uniref:Uncharacterized protein n=1 Tax=Paenibacillus amylolyticus TaxID=1451 RepID=A0A5M9WVU6_PAEAM|nr:hypothetical protein EC604_17300 [Paenibacillus amylolyticus]
MTEKTEEAKRSHASWIFTFYHSGTIFLHKKRRGQKKPEKAERSPLSPDFPFEKRESKKIWG